MAADAAASRTRPPRALASALGRGRPFRRLLGRDARAHVDRALPFLFLHRQPAPDPASLARAVATTSPAYVAWTPDADRAALAMVGSVAAALGAVCPRVLLVSLYDLPRDETIDRDDPALERFVARISASDDDGARQAAAALEAALAKLEVDLRTCKVETVSQAWFEPGLEALLARGPGLSHLSVGLPQNYRIPGSRQIYPQLLHDLAVGIFDALLQAVHAFLREVSGTAPASHRALGRHAFIAAARNVDRKLFGISTSFDFLLSVSPIDTAQAYERFKGARHAEEPVFRYRPLTVDPDLARRALYAIDLKRVEDPVLETLFAEKRHELDQQLTMLHARNTPAFRYGSLMLYGPVEPALLDSARDVLAHVAPDRKGDDPRIDCHAVRDAAAALVGRYRAANPDFRVDIQLREDLAAGLMVSGHRLLISTHTHMRRARLDALLQHEVSIHLLTCVNGAAQGLRIFETGLAGYEGVQEGLGVLAEYAAGGLTAARLRLLAARVLVVDAMIGGASFVECYRLLHDAYGFGARTAFNIVARVFRSGGLTKDAIYLRGFRRLIDLLGTGADLAPFWLGKIDLRHLDIVGELASRGLLRPPRSTPLFLEQAEARARLESLRSPTALSRLI